MRVLLIKRIFKAYQTIGLTFGRWISPIFVGLYLLTLRAINFIFIGLIFKCLFRYVSFAW